MDHGIKGRIAVGYWKSKHEPSLPDPHDHVDLNWDRAERVTVLEYLQAGKELVRWRGWSNCRICNARNGSQCLGDDTYNWPKGLAHYIDVHNVRMPDEFIQHILGKLGL